MNTISVAVPSRSSGESHFTDRQIEQIACGSPMTIAEWTRSIASAQQISIRSSKIKGFAREASRLSDAETDLDSVEELLIALRRAHILTPFQRGLLQVQYLR